MFSCIYYTIETDAFDFALLKELLRKMKDKQPVDIPQYSFVKHAREKGVVTHVEPAEIVLFEGILAFHEPEVAALCDLKIFVDIGNNLCFSFCARFAIGVACFW